jgi:hypothetical protein
VQLNVTFFFRSSEKENGGRRIAGGTGKKNKTSGV